MVGVNDGLQAVLTEIRDLLVPISECFREEYQRIQRERAEFARFKDSLTDVRGRIYPLLFDPRHLRQVEIGKEAGASQQTVSAFINSLLKQGWIEKDDTGELPYRERFPFREMLLAESGNE